MKKLAQSLLITEALLKTDLGQSLLAVTTSVVGFKFDTRRLPAKLLNIASVQLKFTRLMKCLKCPVICFQKHSSKDIF